MDKEYAEYLMKKTSQDYNLIANHFSRAREKSWEEFKFLFEKYLKPNDKVLDLGCGNGRFYEFCQDKKVDYFGVDNSKKLIEIAKKRYPQGKFQIADALHLPFPSCFFDKVYSLALLHHIPSKNFRIKFFKEVKRVLKPEGLLILTVWNLWKNWSRRKLIYKFGLLKLFGFTKVDFKDIFISWYGIPQCYFHCFTKKELEKLAEKTGFEIKKSGEIIISKKKREHSNFYIILKKPPSLYYDSPLR